MPLFCCCRALDTHAAWLEGGAAAGAPPAGTIGSGRRLTESALKGVPRPTGGLFGAAPAGGWASLLPGPLAPLAERHDDAEAASSGSGEELLPFSALGAGRQHGVSFSARVASCHGNQHFCLILVSWFTANCFPVSVKHKYVAAHVHGGAEAVHPMQFCALACRWTAAPVVEPRQPHQLRDRAVGGAARVARRRAAAAGPPPRHR